VLEENTAEAILAQLSVIDEFDALRYYEPSSLEDEIAIIAKSLSGMS